MDAAFNLGPKFGSEFGEMGSEQKQKQNQRAEVDTSAPFESVMEAVTRFGGIGFWKPHIHPPSQSDSFDPQTNNEEALDAAKLESEATESHKDLETEERETVEMLKEIEATKARFEELKVKLQEEEVKVKTQQFDDENNNGDMSKVQVDEATKEVKSCTRVLEEANRQDSDCNLLISGPTMSIGQILSRKLVMAQEHSEKSSIRWKVSQILNKSSNREKRCGGGRDGDGERGLPAKRMKFGFGGISFTKKTKTQSR